MGGACGSRLVALGRLNDKNDILWFEGIPNFAFINDMSS